jgi:hypothetical protein
LIIVAAIAALILIVALGMALAHYRRTKRLKDHFGPEYDKTLDRLGDKAKAEDELEERLEHMQYLNIRSLDAEEVNRFALEWEKVQAEFVDTPLTAVQKANRLIREVMSTRGYPVEDFDQRVADISVDYPDLAANYRELHDIATKSEQEKLSTEEMRQAMLHGRELFENLLQRVAKTEEAHEKEAA